MQYQKQLIYALALLVMTTSAASAQDFAPVTQFLSNIIDFLTGTFARSVGIIAVIFAGIGLLGGRLEGRTFFTILGGLVLIFGAATIIDGFAT